MAILRMSKVNKNSKVSKNTLYDESTDDSTYIDSIESTSEEINSKKELDSSESSVSEKSRKSKRIKESDNSTSDSEDSVSEKPRKKKSKRNKESDNSRSDCDKSVSEKSKNKSEDESEEPKKEPKMNSICFKDINDDYAWGKYGKFKVIVMKKNGYINVTNLCANAKSKNGKTKEFKNWKANTNSGGLISETSSVAGISASDLFTQISGGRNFQLRGTYAHPKLVPHIASWASPKFAVMVSDIVNDFFIKKAMEEKEALLKKKDDKIDKLNNKIDKLLKNNKKTATQNDKLLKNNEKLLNKNKKMDNRIKRLLSKNDELYDQNEEILYKVDVISNDRVPPTNSELNNHVLCLVKNNDDLSEYSSDTDVFEYHIIRCMYKCLGAQLSKHKKKHPDMKILKTISYSPNSMNLWLRIKSNLSPKKITVNKCKFNIRKRYTEKELLSDIDKIHNERYDNSDIK